MGGGENLDSKAFMMLHASAEAFLSAMVLDGTLEQFPRLRGGVIELGALWVPPWLMRLDGARRRHAGLRAHRPGPALADEAFRLGPPPAQIHTPSKRARRLDNRAGW